MSYKYLLSVMLDRGLIPAPDCIISHDFGDTVVTPRVCEKDVVAAVIKFLNELPVEVSITNTLRTAGSVIDRHPELLSVGITHERPHTRASACVLAEERANPQWMARLLDTINRSCSGADDFINYIVPIPKLSTGKRYLDRQTTMLASASVLNICRLLDTGAVCPSRIITGMISLQRNDAEICPIVGEYISSVVELSVLARAAIDADRVGLVHILHTFYTGVRANSNK